MSVKYYNHINDFLDTIGIPHIKHQNFYIVKFEDYDFKINSPRTAYKHDFFEISFTVGYDALLSIEDKTVNTLDYNLVFASPGQVIKWKMEGEQPKDSVSYMILFKPEFLPFAHSIFNLFETFPYFNSFTLSGYKLNLSQKQLFANCFKEMYAEYKIGSGTQLEILKSYLTILLFKAKRELEYSEEKSFLKTRRQEITYMFELLVKQSKVKHKPIKYYADQLNVSSIYLSECIKKVTNKTAKQVINEYLILEAKSLLKQSDYPVFEIGRQLGFVDDSNFVKYFKKQTGLTPKQYRIYKD